jgi:hypothetical protein
MAATERIQRHKKKRGFLIGLEWSEFLLCSRGEYQRIRLRLSIVCVDIITVAQEVENHSYFWWIPWAPTDCCHHGSYSLRIVIIIRFGLLQIGKLLCRIDEPIFLDNDNIIISISETCLPSPWWYSDVMVTSGNTIIVMWSIGIICIIIIIPDCSAVRSNSPATQETQFFARCGQHWVLETISKKFKCNCNFLLHNAVYEPPTTAVPLSNIGPPRRLSELRILGEQSDTVLRQTMFMTVVKTEKKKNIRRLVLKWRIFFSLSRRFSNKLTYLSIAQCEVWHRVLL